jgi:putative DNA primase/helicase
MYDNFYRSHLSSVKHRNGQINALCPFHEDHNPSFSVNIKTGQYKCHGCNEKGNAFTFAQKRNIPRDQVPGYNPNYNRKPSFPKKPREYNYTDEKGNTLFQVTRSNSKKFIQRRPNEKGGWTFNRKGIKQVLYNLPCVINSQEITIVEGEKDADNLKSLGYVATTNPGGAGKWLNEYNHFLQDKDLICFYDNDDPGKDHIRKIIDTNLGNARSIRLVYLPVINKGDVSDYLTKNKPEDLKKIIEFAPEISDISQVDLFFKDLNDFPLTDSGNAETVVKLYGSRIRFDHNRRRFLVWQPDQHRWVIDETGEIDRIILKTMRDRQRSALEIDDSDRRGKVIKWAVDSESHYRIEACNKRLSTLYPIATTVDKFDCDPMLLGCKNGVIDLRTGSFRPGKPNDNVSKSLNVEYDSNAKALRFEQFLREVFLDDPEMIAYVLRAAGYSLTGLTTEQVIFILHGSGENGKSVFLNVLSYILGDYSGNTPFNTFMSSKVDPGRIPNDIAALVGKRFVTASEVKENSCLNEARIKNLTGGDQITARFLHQEFFTYIPNYKIWLSVNHRPRVKDTSHGFWRRIKEIPFDRKFSGSERDYNLLEKLKSEASGILNLLIKGCLEWKENGLGSSTKVDMAVEGYRNEMDVVRQFLTENILEGGDAVVEATQLYASFENWCHKNGEEKMNGTRFGTKMKELGYKKGAYGPRRRIHYFGLGLLDTERVYEK